MQFEENNYQYCQQDSEPKFEGVPCCLYGDMKECRICRYVKDNLPKKKAWKLRQLGHLSNIFRLSCLCFTFFPTLKKKKGFHNHTSSMLWDKNCGPQI